jgi:hypothetical protein
MSSNVGKIEYKLFKPIFKLQKIFLKTLSILPLFLRFYLNICKIMNKTTISLLSILKNRFESLIFDFIVIGKS